MKILNEIIRIREIMGIKTDSRLLTEVVNSTLIRLFRKLLQGTASTTDDVIIALRKSIDQSATMRELGGMKGLTMRNIRMVDEVSEVIYEILSKHTDDIIIGDPKMLREFLESSLGVSGVSDELAEIIAGKFALDGQNIGLKVFREILQASGAGVSKLVQKLFTGAGKSSRAKAKFMQEVMASFGVNNIDDLTKFLKHIGVEDDTVIKMIKHVQDGGDLLTKEFLDEIVTKAVTKADFEDLAVSVFGKSAEFKNFIKKQKIFKQKQIADLLGLAEDDAILIQIYETLIQDTYFKKAWYYFNKKMSHTWFTWWDGKFLEFKMNAYKLIFTYLPVVTLANAWTDGLLEAEFRSAYQKSPAGLSLTPDVYMKAMGNPAYVKDKGGLTNEEAKKIAQDLLYYLTPTFGLNFNAEDWLMWCKKFPMDCKKTECYKKNIIGKKLDLNNLPKTSSGEIDWDKWDWDCIQGVTFDKAQFLGTNDGAVESIFKNKIHTTLAASQVTYFYNKIAGGGDTLDGDLGNMTMSYLPGYLFKNLTDLDYRRVDILKILDKKVFAYGIETEADIKKSWEMYGKMLKDYWPTFPDTLKSKECWCTKKENGKNVPDYSSLPSEANCTDDDCPGAEREKFYTRLIGDIPFDMLGAYVTKCGELNYNIYSRGAINNCLDNMDPFGFNTIWTGSVSPRNGEDDVYGSEYKIADAKTLTLDFVEIFGSEDGRDALEERIKELEKKIQEKKN